MLVFLKLKLTKFNLKLIFNTFSAATPTVIPNKSLNYKPQNIEHPYNKINEGWRDLFHWKKKREREEKGKKMKFITLFGWK